MEALTILYGLLSARTLVPLRARIEGWRAAGEGPRLGVPAGAVDERITLRETMSRLRHERWARAFTNEH